jgi:hypothetical protein
MSFVLICAGATMAVLGWLYLGGVIRPDPTNSPPDGFGQAGHMGIPIGLAVVGVGVIEVMAEAGWLSEDTVLWVTVPFIVLFLVGGALFWINPKMLQPTWVEELQRELEAAELACLEEAERRRATLGADLERLGLHIDPSTIETAPVWPDVQDHYEQMRAARAEILRASTEAEVELLETRRRQRQERRQRRQARRQADRRSR